MFVGHYAVSMALKSKDKKASLGVLFLAVQFVDILFFPLAVFGVERFRIEENYTAASDLVLEYMPFTHSLAAALVWGLIAFVVFRLYAGGRRLPAVMAVAVASHWFLDLIVHTPDLPLLFDDGPKVGFGLWNYPAITFVLESVLLVIGLSMYMRATHARTRIGQYGMPALVVALVVINAINLFGAPPDETIRALAASALMLYFAIATLAFWLDRHRG
ncbi:MAG: hypothetical protein R2834_23745 [Rhodothermales bacterium]